MQNFEFQLSTRIVFGRDTIKQTGAEIARSCRKVLLVCGKGSVRRSGVFDAVVASLRDAGVAWVEFGGVRSNPLLSQVHEAVQLAKREGVDGILGVGGGSAIDSAKAIAAGAASDRDVWAFIDGTATVEKALPVFAVITLAATGTELNGLAVVTNDITKQKWPLRSPLIQPRVSILDPTATFSVPRDYTAYGGVDAFSHVVEAYLVWPEPSTPLQDRMSEALAMTIVEAAETCVRSPHDYEARASLMWAAALGWCGLIPAGAGRARLPNHMMEHSLSALHDVPHGAGLSAIIPGWARYMVESGQSGKLPRLARNVFGVNEKDDRKAALAGIAAFEAWCQRLGSPTRIGQFGSIPKSALPAIVDNAAVTAIAWGMGDAYPRDVIAAVLDGCW
ncbi:MAG: hypothetical protein A3K19_25150 [Lentisphaerae bacterium RIFOXYB12_FULL_65_16]|nr:MAG: hypothetical protein A3K18_00755 [Lentisphaerae bacterium RIFOXYA12_64_32]OGV91033.1 MAG: hypothetical protein A3K19_25150 [Lentisphaerae bacterium RIFOXYB12_FULL_65_16]